MPSKTISEVIKRLTMLETKMQSHLEESGGIRADLAFLKKAFWTLVAGGVTFNVSLAVGVVLYLLKA